MTLTLGSLPTRDPSVLRLKERQDAMLLYNPLNVKLMGAVGDGVTDDTGAFEFTRDRLLEAGGGTMFVPPGTYLLKNFELGEGTATASGFQPTVYLRGSGVDNTIFRGTSDIGASDYILEIRCHALGGVLSPSGSGGEFGSFTVDGQGRDTEHHGLLIEGGNMRFRNISVRSVNGHGIHFGPERTVRECFFNAITVRGCGRHSGAGGSSDNAALLFDVPSVDGTELNNLHIQGLQIIYPWYAGIHVKAEDGKATRQLFFSQLMLHGWESGANQQGRLHADAAMVWLNGPTNNVFFNQLFLTRIGSDDDGDGLGTGCTAFRFDSGSGSAVGPDYTVIDTMTPQTSDRGRMFFFEAARDVYLNTIETVNPGANYPDGKVVVDDNIDLDRFRLHIRDCFFGTPSVKTFLTPQEFGAQGDGVNDDTAAVQAAINEAASQRIECRIPPGTYNISTIYLTHDAVNNPDFPDDAREEGRFRLRGAGRMQINNVNAGDRLATVFVSSSTTTAAIVAEGDESTNPLRGLVVGGFTVIQDSTGYVIDIERGNFCDFEDIAIEQQNIAGGGMRWLNPFAVNLRKILILNTGSGTPTGIGLKFSHDTSQTSSGGSMNRLMDVTARDFDKGLELGATATATGTSQPSQLLINCQFGGNASVGADILNAVDATLIACHFEGAQAKHAWVRLSGGAAFLGCSLSFHSTTTVGIQVGDSAGTGQPEKIGFATIERCTFRNIQSGGTGVLYEAAQDTKGVQIIANRFDSASAGVGTGIDMGGTVQHGSFIVGNHYADSLGTNITGAQNVDLLIDADAVVIGNQSVFEVPTSSDANRGAAGTPGRVIYNTDDGILNVDDGSDWLTLATEAGTIATTGGTMTGVLVFDDTLGGAPIQLDNQSGTATFIRHETNGVNRWAIGRNATAESGSNVGSDFELIRYADDGSVLGRPFDIERATGNVTFEADIECEDETTGLILTDRTLGTRHRIVLDNGALSIEAA